MKSADKPALSVLIVEDDREALEMMALVIGKKFPELAIRTADNGGVGLELCSRQLPDIVVTDINMTRMDGLQMATAIQSMKQDALFIVLTGHSDKSNLEKFNELGAMAYIVKPINFKKLFGAVQTCVEQIRPPEGFDGC
jgi:YesN/AraC family two-component response regulator